MQVKILKQSARLDYLDGLRGLAALVVAWYHFSTFYDPGLESNIPAECRFGWESWIARTPLNFFMQGNLMVHIFFVLSGYVLIPAFQQSFTFLGALGRRYVRLVLPIFASCLLCWIFDQLRVNYNIGGPVTFPKVPSDLGEVFNQSFILVPFTMATEQFFNQAQWTMSIEWYGSIMLMIFCVIQRSKLFDPYLFLLICTLVSWDYYQFFMLCGAWLYLLKKEHLIPERLASWQYCLISLLAVIYGTYPFLAKASHFYTMLTFHLAPIVPMNSFNPFAFVVEDGDRTAFFHGVAAVMIVYLVTITPILKQVLSKFTFLGKISFSLYLVHYPLLFPTCWFYYYGSQHHAVLLGFIGSLVTFFGSSVLLAWAITRWVDQPAIKLSRAVGSRLDQLVLKGAGSQDGQNARA